MNKLTAPWNDNDKIIAGNALEKLFIFQGLKYAKDQMMNTRNLFCEELSLRGLPLGAVLSGIRKLESEDLRSIKLSHVVSAALDFFEPMKNKSLNCQYCEGIGFITRKDENSYMFSSRCLCHV